MPREIFIIESMGITQTAIDRGTYMKPCGDKEIIMHILSELTDGYVRLYDWDDFVKLCYETVLKHSPDNLSALMVKNNYLYHRGTRYLELLKTNRLPRSNINYFEEEYWNNLEAIEATGHVDMPANLYDEWIKSIEKEINRRETNNSN